MPDFPAIGKALSDLGGWTAFLTLVVVIAVTGAKRVWVWGWMFDRLEKRADTSDTQAERNADSLATMSDSYAVMARSYDRLERDYDTLSGRRVNRDAT